MINEFLTKVWSLHSNTQPTYYCISTKIPNGPFKDYFFQNIDEAVGFAERMNGSRNVYFAPNAFSIKRRKKENVIPSRVLYADLEERSPEKLFLRPNIAWASSTNRYSCIWIMEKPLKVQELEELNQRITYRCNADKGGWDSVQVLRLPGTKNLKYSHKPTAKTLWIEDTKYNREDFNVKIKPETLRLLNQKEVNGHDRSVVLFKLECELCEQGLSRNEIFDLIRNSAWNKFKGRRNEEQWLNTELDKVFTKTGIRIVDNKPLICLDDVVEETVQWLWRPYFPKGKLVLIEGDPGEGKSWFTLAIVSAVSNGKPILGNPIEEGTCLIFNAEDGLGDTIKPRLRKLGANFKNIYAPERLLSFDVDEDYDYIIDKVKIYSPSVIIIDPLVAYMGGRIDLHKANQTRVIMTRLKELAEFKKTTIVCIRHLTKSSREKIIYRGQGSIDLTAAVRSQLMIGPSPHDKNYKIMCQIKMSIEKEGPPIKYHLNRNGGFEWVGPVDFNPEEWMKEKKPFKVNIVEGETPKITLRDSRKNLPN